MLLPCFPGKISIRCHAVVASNANSIPIPFGQPVLVAPGVAARVLLGLGLCWGLLSASVTHASVDNLTFEQDIRPILKAHCFDCHGEGEELKGKLDLRLRRLMVQGGESGPAIVPGQPEKSLLIELVRSGKMPKRGKPLTLEDIQRLETWIAGGARTARAEPESMGTGMAVTAEEREHWAFKPLRPMALPRLQNDEQVRHPIDAFLGVSLQMRHLKFSPEADRVTLIRRAYFDLLGLPPTPAEVAAFVQDNEPEAYERLLDQLLASPHYGERWARHWLDAAGYADSDGYAEADQERPHAFRYRDYVIRSMNQDKPFDQFLTEQLAGDELVLATHTNLEQAVTDPAAVDRLVATGFLRMGADGTGSPGVDQDAARNAVVADTIKILSTSLLGLSVGCAQCHDHRYDPISHVDYYHLRALLEPAYDWKQWRNPAQRLVSLYTPQERAKAGAVEAEASTLSQERAERQKKYLEEALEEHLKKFDESLRGPLREAYHAHNDKRTAEQKKLLADHPSVNIHPGVLYQYNPKAADDLKAMDARITRVRGGKPEERFIQALTEVPGQVPVTYRFHRGDPKQPREQVAPGMLSVLSSGSNTAAFASKDNGLATSGRRLALARWLTGTHSALFPRVWVNRVWMHHFGRGLVGTPADFGLQGERPTHPELLDWLAAQFAAPGDGSSPTSGLGWSLKRLHKLIMTSAAYRQSSRQDPERERIDPENRFYWRKPVMRLDAEAIRDATLAVSGALEPSMFGPPVPVREDASGQIVVGIDKREGDNKMPVDVAMGGAEFRRSVYVQVRRSRPLAFLNAFDAPVMEVNCERRTVSTAAPQALMLMNSGFILQQSALFAERVRRESGEDLNWQIDRSWQLAWGRLPDRAEREQARQFLERQARTMRAENPSGGASGKTGTKPEMQALTDLCQALLSANEFLYVD